MSVPSDATYLIIVILTPVLVVMLGLSILAWYLAYRRSKSVNHGMVSFNPEYIGVVSFFDHL